MTEAGDFAHRLLDWYDHARRDLPWRAVPGEASDPYHVWLSEIMLQQTTVKAVAPYFAKFLQLWPAIEDLAMADTDDVLAAWAGLGYYARARNLHRCARTVSRNHGGRFPDTEDALRELPGIGPYTAAAIAAIAFGRKATVVDGNVERVIARWHAVEAPLPRAKTELRQLAEVLTPARRPGDYAQAMMDLGATICSPRSPACGSCPVSADCLGRARGIEHSLPRKAVRAGRPTRRGTAYFAARRDGAVLLRKRPERGLLGGMLEVPSAGWSDAAPVDEPPFETGWTRLPGGVRHTFTHFHLELTVHAACQSDHADVELREGWRWVPREDLGAQALPSVMRKVIAHALEHVPEAAG